MEHLCGKQVKSDSTDKGCLTRHIGAGNKDRTATKRNVIGDTMLYKRMIKALCMKRFTLVTSFRKSIIGQPIPKLGNRAKRIHQSKIAENLFNLFLLPCNRKKALETGNNLPQEKHIHHLDEEISKNGDVALQLDTETESGKLLS